MLLAATVLIIAALVELCGSGAVIAITHHLYAGVAGIVFSVYTLIWVLGYLALSDTSATIPRLKRWAAALPSAMGIIATAFIVLGVVFTLRREWAYTVVTLMAYVIWRDTRTARASFAMRLTDLETNADEQ
jgi:hypothetical protein